MASCLLRLIMVGVVLMGCLRMAHLADIERRAPVIIAEDVAYCDGSPGHKYITFHTFSARQGHFLDTKTHEIYNVPLPSSAEHTQSLWLPNDRYLYYTEYKEHRSPDIYYESPANGWIVDITAQTVTDITTLPQPLQQQILQDADRASQPNPFSSISPSPDGQYGFSLYGETATILANDQTLNDIWAFRKFWHCINGWRSDSGGYYFIDGPFLGDRRGPMRLLLTHPPPPYLPIVWLVLGALGITLIWRYQWLWGLLRRRVRKSSQAADRPVE